MGDLNEGLGGGVHKTAGASPTSAPSWQDHFFGGKDRKGGKLSFLRQQPFHFSKYCFFLFCMGMKPAGCRAYLSFRGRKGITRCLEWIWMCDYDKCYFVLISKTNQTSSYHQRPKASKSMSTRLVEEAMRFGYGPSRHYLLFDTPKWHCRWNLPTNSTWWSSIMSWVHRLQRSYPYIPTRFFWRLFWKLLLGS